MKQPLPNLKARKIVTVVQTFPVNPPFLALKFSGLLNDAMNVVMVCLERPDKEAKKIIAADERLRRRVSFGYQLRWRNLIFFPVVLLLTLFSNPRATLRYFIKGRKSTLLKNLKQFWLDAPIIREKPDLIHYEFGPLAVERMYLGELLECKQVVSFRGYDLNFVGLEQHDYYKEVWENADGLHFLGNDLWERAQKRGCPVSKKHVLISPAINTDFFKNEHKVHENSAAIKEHPVRILSVGRLVWKKGYEYALQAMKLLKEQGVYFYYEIIGNGPYLEAIAYTRHDLDLEDCVQLLGKLSPGEVKEKMKQADIFLHAAVSEGFCNAVLEAQAMQLPVVTSDADGLSENIVDGETGFVVPRRDPQLLAEKVKFLAKNPECRGKMGVAGRARVKKCFQLQDQIKAFEKLYADILS